MNGGDRERTPGDLFFGRIVAGTSHELTNVLNIVGELAGLQDDLLQGAAAGEPLDPARLAQLSERVRRQVERGQAMLRQLNRFAHTVDHMAEPYDVGEVLESLVALTERFARLARTRLELQPPPSTVTVAGDPFAMMLAVFTCIELALASASEARAVRLLVERDEPGARVVVDSSDPLPAADGPLPAVLERALAASPGSLVQRPGPDNPHRYVIALRDLRAGSAASTEAHHAP